MKNYLLLSVFCALAVGAHGAGNRQVLIRQNQALDAQIAKLNTQLTTLTTATNNLLAGTNIPAAAASVATSTGTVNTATATTQGGIKQANKIETDIQAIVTKLGALGGLSDAQAATFGRMIEYLNQMADARSIFQANAVAFLAAPRLVTNPANLALQSADIKETPKIRNTTTSTSPETRTNSAAKAAANKTTDEAAASVLITNLQAKLKGTFANYYTEWFDTGKPLNAAASPTSFDFVQHLGSMKSDYEDFGPNDPDVAQAINDALDAYKKLVHHEGRPSQTVEFDKHNYSVGTNKNDPKRTALTLDSVDNPANYDAYWKQVEAVRASYELALSLYIDRFTEALNEELDPKTCTKVNTTKDGFEPNIELLLHLNGLICDAVTDLVWFDLDAIDRLMVDYAAGASKNLIAEAVTTELNKLKTGAKGDITDEIIAAMANISAALAASGTAEAVIKTAAEQAGKDVRTAAAGRVAAAGAAAGAATGATYGALAADTATAAATDANITTAVASLPGRTGTVATTFDYSTATWPTGATCVLATYKDTTAETAKAWTFWDYNSGAIKAFDSGDANGFKDQLKAIADKKTGTPGSFSVAYPAP